MLPTVETQSIDWASFGDLKDAARARNFGQVIRRARQLAGLSQVQLGVVCGLSQPAVSRLENRGVSDYNMTTLASVATALDLPFELVGLANQQVNGPSPVDVERRELLAAAVVAVVAPPAPPAGAKTPEWGDSPAAALRIATTSFRRMDATTASRDFSDAMQSHLRLIQAVGRDVPDGAQRARMASVGSEAASFARWLAWDMSDHGSARRWYGTAVKAAHSAGDPLLIAYQTGSLAAFEADTGNQHQAMRLVHQARAQFGCELPPLTAAWLSSIEAVAHAANDDRRAYDRALKACAQSAARIPDADPVAWPWIFAFDERKVAACRVACMARLGRPLHARIPDQDIATALSSAHDKQRALLTLDVATGYLATKEVDTAFSLATRALAEGVRLRSGRIVERARALRRTYVSASPPHVVREFDNQLHTAYL